MAKDNPVQSMLKNRGFKYKKQLGQNFIFNSFILNQIADEGGVEEGDLIIEAGAGAGTLTEVMASRGARVIAVEFDRALTPILKEQFKDEEAVELIQGDVMSLELDRLAEEAGAKEYKIVANLPYQISTPFLTRMFRQLKGLTGGAVMVQKEVAMKVTAEPGEEGYGMLALAAAAFGQVELAFVLEPGYFTPPPPVDSAVIAFRRCRPELGVEDKALWLLIRGVMNQRRKNILNGLKSLGAFQPKNGLTWPEALEEAGISREVRGETLSLEEFADIVRAAGYASADQAD